MKENMRRILGDLSLAGMLLFAGLSVREMFPYVDVEIEDGKLPDRYLAAAGDGMNAGETETEDDSNAASEDTFMNISVDFEELQKLNTDIIGWICIPETRINGPILQHPEDDSYYLNHLFNKKENKLGSFFVSHEFSNDFSDAHVVIFGHNMASGQRFGQLSDYENSVFRESHPYVYMYVPGRILKCEVFSAGVCSVSDPVYRLDHESDTPVYTLSTCVDSGDYEKRFIVNCRLTELRQLEK